ncbi:MAG: SAM-dependent methyltransferase, partial [Candidatus Dormibacteria bacterium]
MAERARETEAGLWERAGVVPGAAVADVGCGPGAVLVLLAEIVGDAGSVTGVEPDPQARAAAEDEIAQRGLT